MQNKYKQVSRSFGKIAQEYDAWYEDNILFSNEIEALKSLGPVISPSLEVGVGTGRFASMLGFDFGLDPSPEMLAIARRRGLRVVCGVAEALPLASESLASVGLFFTLCFLGDPYQALREAHRVLKRQGRLFLGLVPRESPWGEFYTQRAQKGHPLYQYARFLTLEQVQLWSNKLKFSLEKAASTLFGLPQAPAQKETPKAGIFPEAGFVALVYLKRG